MNYSSIFSWLSFIWGGGGKAYDDLVILSYHYSCLAYAKLSPLMIFGTNLQWVIYAFNSVPKDFFTEILLELLMLILTFLLINELKVQFAILIQFS